MTAATQFKILEILEPALGRQKATEFTERIEDIVDTKFLNETKTLATKDDLHKTSAALKDDLNKTSAALRDELNKTSLLLKEEIYKVSEKLESRIWTAFITLAVMILGLYATIIFRH